MTASFTNQSLDSVSIKLVKAGEKMKGTYTVRTDGNISPHYAALTIIVIATPSTV